MSHCDITVVIVENDWEGFCAHLVTIDLYKVRFSWFQERSSFYWHDSDVFSIFRGPDFGCHSDSQKMTIWDVRSKTVIVISWLLGGLFSSFKVLYSCILISSDISDGSYVSTMSHCDVTLIFVNWCMWKHRLVLTGHFHVMTHFLSFEGHNTLYLALWNNSCIRHSDNFISSVFRSHSTCTVFSIFGLFWHIEVILVSQWLNFRPQLF